MLPITTIQSCQVHTDESARPLNHFNILIRILLRCTQWWLHIWLYIHSLLLLFFKQITQSVLKTALQSLQMEKSKTALPCGMLQSKHTYCRLFAHKAIISCAAIFFSELDVFKCYCSFKEAMCTSNFKLL